MTAHPVSPAGTSRIGPVRTFRGQRTYWITTALVIAECVAGGVLDLARQAPFYPAMIHLGYPSYFADLLGTAKLLAAAALLVPGLPRLTEWAYAGIMFNMIGAAVSHLAVGDGAGDVVPPAAFGVIALVSCLSRPPSAGRGHRVGDTGER